MYTVDSSVTGDTKQPPPNSPVAMKEDLIEKPTETQSLGTSTVEDEERPKSSALRPPTPPGFRPRGKIKEPVKGGGGKPKPK